MISVASWMFLTGCSEDEPAPSKLSRKGESCRVRADCNEGLSCVQSVCITSEFSISPTAKECAIIECVAPEDCCPPMGPDCEAYLTECEAGEDYACGYYDQYCKCDASSYACEDNTCKANLNCQEGMYCPGYYVCDTAINKCVECISDGDCDSGTEVCRNGVCANKCNLDSDCPYFNRCNNGECVDSGCLTDRECKAAAGNALAVCVEGDCRVPCQTNLECGSPENNFNFQSCVDGQCVYVGCESDKECQLYLNQMGDGDTQVVCRDNP
jgi:hypothetical protein